MKTNQQILEGAPKGVTHYDTTDNDYYIISDDLYDDEGMWCSHYWSSNALHKEWVKFHDNLCSYKGLRSLADIEALAAKDRQIAKLKNSVDKALNHLYSESDEGPYNACCALGGG